LPVPPRESWIVNLAAPCSGFETHTEAPIVDGYAIARAADDGTGDVARRQEYFLTFRLVSKNEGFRRRYREAGTPVSVTAHVSLAADQSAYGHATLPEPHTLRALPAAAFHLGHYLGLLQWTLALDRRLAIVEVAGLRRRWIDLGALNTALNRCAFASLALQEIIHLNTVRRWDFFWLAVGTWPAQPLGASRMGLLPAVTSVRGGPQDGWAISGCASCSRSSSNSHENTAADSVLGRNTGPDMALPPLWPGSRAFGTKPRPSGSDNSTTRRHGAVAIDMLGVPLEPPSPDDSKELDKTPHSHPHRLVLMPRCIYTAIQGLYPHRPP
jgi:hypothetical protein